MEGKKGNDSSSAGGVFEGKSFSSSATSGLIDSLFPRPCSMAGKGSDDILGAPINRGYAVVHRHACNDVQDADDHYLSKENKKTKRSVCQKGEPACFLGDSLNYGGQDICSQQPHTSSNTSGFPYNNKKDGKDYSAGSSSDHASRGNWWKGSLHY